MTFFPKVIPLYRTDTLAFPLNSSKPQKARSLVMQFRSVAEQETAHQWRAFFRSRWAGFETPARMGWTRP